MRGGTVGLVGCTAGQSEVHNDLLDMGGQMNEELVSVCMAHLRRRT